MSLENKLKSLNLNDREIKIYLFLLESGLSSPPEISKGTDIARGNAHYVIKELVSQGLVKKQKKGKRFAYLPADPSATLGLLEKKREVLEEALPDLRALYKKETNKPSIKFYEGVDELKLIFEEVLESEYKQVYGFTSTKKLFELIPDYFQSRFQKELKKREIFLKDILSFESGQEVAAETASDAGLYYEYKVIDKKYGELPSDVLVWDDKVATLTLEEPVFGTVIKSKHLADTYRIQFKVMWQSLPNSKKGREGERETEFV